MLKYELMYGGEEVNYVTVAMQFQLFRLETILNSDRILVMEQGRVKELETPRQWRSYTRAYQGIGPG